jgi:uncharacterized protein involved in exopolysaccharide biosynthesis
MASSPIRPPYRRHDSSSLPPYQSPRPAALSLRDPEREDPLVDVALLRQVAGFPLRAVRRHRTLSAAIVAAVLAAGVLAVVILPRTYSVQARILAQRNVVMPALNNPRRAVPTESDAPTRLASETVLQRESLLRIIREANLLARWPQIRSPLGRLKERVVSVVRQPLTDEERIDMLVETLRLRLWVNANDQAAEGTVTIGVDWPERHTALAIVQAAQESFLEQRHTTEVARIGESISIIERYVAGARSAIDSTLRGIPVRARQAGARGGAAAFAAATGPATARVTPEVAGLQASLAMKRTMIQDLVTARTQRLTNLQAQLAELRKSYGAAHPEVKAAEHSIAEVTADSPQLALLREEERTLVARLAALGAPETLVASNSGSADVAIAHAALQQLERADSLADPRVIYAQAQLKMMVSNYEDLLNRLESAHIELETARAAFKYRYSVVTPAQLPKAPIKPKVPLLLVGSVVAGVMLAVFAAVALDLAGGRLLESWQVERALGLPLLGEVDRL